MFCFQESDWFCSSVEPILSMEEVLKPSEKRGTRTPCTDCLKKIIFYCIHSISSLRTG